MSSNFAKLAAVFAILVLGAGIAFNQFMGASAEGFTKEEIQDIVKETINENPSLIVEAFTKYRQEQQEAQQREQREMFLKNKDKVLKSDYSPTFGSDADDAVVVVEFFDYNCGYCKRAIDAVNTVIEEDNNVRFIFKELPILSPSSTMAAKYALAAQEQGKYLEYHTALMKHQGQKDEKVLESLAKEIGLDVEKLKKDADSSKVQKELEENKQIASQIGVRGTPAFIIGDSITPGFIPLDQMQRLIEQAKEES